MVDGPLHTVYVVNQKDDTLSAVNTNVCNGAHLAACATLHPPTIHTGEDPESVTVNTGTQTLYTANQVTNDVSVIDAARCNATDTRGCRQPPPAITLPGPGPMAADPAVGTLYVPTCANTVAMINTRTCNASPPRRVHPTPPTVKVGAFPAGRRQPANPHRLRGQQRLRQDRQRLRPQRPDLQRHHHQRLHERPHPAGPGRQRGRGRGQPGDRHPLRRHQPASGPTGGSPSTVSVFNGATCNATDSSGCAQAPHSVTVGFMPSRSPSTPRPTPST